MARVTTTETFTDVLFHCVKEKERRIKQQSGIRGAPGARITTASKGLDYSSVKEKINGDAALKF
jgi:hypothetical protein